MSDLPKELEAIAEVVGRDAALDLAEAWGGQRIYVPRPAGLGGANPLVQTLGDRLAAKVAKHFAGTTICVPLARRALVQRLSSQGLPAADIAARLKMTLGTVRKYRAVRGAMAP